MILHILLGIIFFKKQYQIYNDNYFARIIIYHNDNKKLGEKF